MTRSWRVSVNAPFWVLLSQLRQMNLRFCFPFAGNSVMRDSLSFLLFFSFCHFSYCTRVQLRRNTIVWSEALYSMLHNVCRLNCKLGIKILLKLFNFVHEVHTCVSVRFWKWKGKIHPNCDHVRLACNHSKYEERRLHKKRTDNGDVDVKVRKKWRLETWQTGTHGLQLQTGQVKSTINYKRKFRAWKTGLPAWQITTLACQFIRRPILVSIETTAALCCHQLLFQASLREMVVYSENTSFTYLLFF